MGWLPKPWRRKILTSKNQPMKRPMMFNNKNKMMKNKQMTMSKWLTMSKLLRMTTSMIRNKLGLLSLTKINKLFIPMLVKMIGNCNAREWPTNLKSNQKMITSNGEQESNQLEMQLILLRKSNKYLMKFPQRQICIVKTKWRAYLNSRQNFKIIKND